MAMTGQINIVGRLTADPDLRFTPNGVAVASFSVAVNRQEKIGDDWKDVGTDFYNCNVWRDMAENVVESLRKGDNVLVYGTLKSRTYTHKDGGDRTVWDIDVLETGPSLRFNTCVPSASVRKALENVPKDKETVKAARASRETRR